MKEVKLRFKFIKRSEYKYLSHLDITRIIIRAVRRAGIKIKYSEGFNPKPKINFSNPTPLGIESVAEYADLVILQDLDAINFIDMMNIQLPKGLKLVKSKVIASKTASLMSDISVCFYSFILKTLAPAEGFKDGFNEEIGEKVKSHPDNLNSILKLEFEKDYNVTDVVFLKLFGYAKIFKERNNRIFKFNNFFGFFQDLIKVYNIRVDYVLKEEMFIFKHNNLKTPMEVIN